MNRSPQNAADGGGFGSRATLTDYPAAKTVYFYKDGDQNFNALKLAVHPRKYRSFNALLNELSSRIPMSFGVRSIYTPRGHDNVGRIDDLSNEGRYVCSTYTNHARGVDLNRLGQARTWHFTRPPSGQRALNTILSPRERDRRNRIRAKRRMEVQKYRPAEPSYNTNGIYPKKITVMKNGEPRQRHIVLLNRRTAQSFEQVLCDLSEMFQMAARKIYTMDGRQIQSLSSIFNGPEVFVVAGTENFRQMDGFSPQPPLVARPRPNGYRSRHFANSDRYVANRLRDRRERLGRTRGRWRVWLTTNELPSAGTDAGVSITVYGTRSNSGPIPLNNDDQELYQSGKIDQFDINVGNIGEVFKIRIAHDNIGEFPNWLCDEVKMRDMDTGEELRFPCKRWLARDEEDGEICRELPAARKGEPVLPIVKYEVAVTTGELWNAGTNANVYLTMYGERGDTGVRQLTAERKDLLFLTGQTNTFHLEAVSLGPIRRVIVGHDATEPGDGWYLEKIVVRDPSKNSNEFVFFCGKWLDSAEDDGKVVRELKAQDEYMTDILEKKYWEYEKWKFGNGSQVMLFSCQTGGALRIKPDATVDASAEVTDPAAIFHVTGKRGMVRVFGSAYHKNFHLAIDNGRLLGQGKGGPYCEFRVRVQADRTVLLESVKYPLQHINIAQNGRPGDVRGMGTAAAKQFHVYCKGMFRDTGIIIIMTSPTQALSVDHENEVMGTGKKSRVSQFRVHKVSEGVRMFESVVSPGQYLQLRQGKIDCKGETEVNSHFIVEKHKDTGYVSLQSFAVRGLYIGMAGDGSVRPTVSTGEKNIWLFPEVLQFGIPKARDETDDAPSPSPAKVPPRTPTPPPTQRREASPVVVVQQTQESPRKATPPPPKAKPASPQKPVEKPQSANSNKSVYNEGDWKVAVSTQETAQNAEIALVVYGDKGQSGQIILGSPDQNLFQKGNLDELKVNLLSVGVIYKIRLELIPAHLEAEAFWKVKEVKLQDAHTKELLKFSFDRWLSLQQDDGEIMRELPALRPGKPELPVIKYRILVHTGTETGSDTDAHVYLTLFGERGDTGRRPLHRSNKDRIFQKGQVDEFWLEAVSLGRLKSCHVSHDGSGFGEGWFCRQVVVREGPDAAMETVFPCDQWLDSSMADKKIERMLTANEERPVPVEEDQTQIVEESYKAGDWKIWVTTGKDDTIKTTEDIVMVAYGETGVSEPVVLGNRGEGVFQPSTTDEFKVNLGGSLGNLYKIRVGHKDMEPSNGWQLDKVKMQDMTTSEVLSFRAGRWLSRGQDDLDTWRELPVVRPGKDPLPVIVYGVEVYTGTEAGADTDATVHINLHGTRGDSGQRILYHSQNNDTKFQSGQVDMFNVEAVSLDEVTKIVIGHDGKGAGAGWFLEKVIVKETQDNQTTEYYFPCNRWLDEGQDDKLIEREILAQPPPADSRGEYKLWISTDPDSKPANGGKVYLTAYGEKGRSKDVEVCASGGKAFEPGNTDEFEVAFGDIGDLYKIRVAREDNSAWEGWYLKEVKLSDKATGKEYLFTVHRWLSRSKDDFDVVRELPVLVENTPILPVCHYEVQVYTGNHWAAATESPAYITLHGQKGDSGKRQLFHSTNNPDYKFQQNQMDSFKVEAVSLEDLTHVVIGHHGTGHGSGWFVDRVVVREKEGQRSNVELIFPCGQWLDDHEADGKTERILRPIDSLDTTQPKPVKDEKKKTQGKWRVLVKTSDIHNAGTHAQAYLTFYGSKATSKPQTLGDGKPDSDVFNQGKETEFNVDIGDIGDLFKLRLEHDNKNDFPAWHVDYLKLSDGDTQEEITVYVDRWLAVDEDDGQLCREFPIVTPTSMPLPVLHYIVVVYTGSQKEAGTDTTIYFNMFGDMGDIGHRTLMDSRTNAEPYQPGQVDVFVLEAVSVGKISKVELFHNGKNKGQSWFVDRVVVLESEAALTETVFQCSDWLEVKDGETMAMKQYTVTDTQPVSHSVRGHLEPTSNGRWTIWASTGTENDAGTKDEVNLIVYGTLGHTEPTLLNPGGEITAGSTIELKITVGVIGRVFKVGLLFGGKEKDSSWFLKKLKMKDDETGQEFHFDYNNWVRATLDNPRGVTELPAIRPDIPPLSETKYIVSVFTGSQHCADTEAGVFCNLIGQWGESGQRPLATPRKSSEPFKKGQVDEFAISSLDLGQLETVVIGHSKSGRGQGWFCERVSVKTLTSPTEQIFVCNRWLDTGCDDRQLVRELLPLASVPIQGDADQDKRREKSKGVWSCLVTMAAASKLSHHTIDAKQPVDVSLVVCGSAGVTESFELGKIRPLLIGNMEEYQGLKFGNVGKVEKIRVVLGKEVDPETIWVLEEIILEDEETKETLRFDFSLFVGKVFTECYKELPAVRPTEPVKPVIPYLVKVHTSSDKDASTDSSVFITLFGKEGDSGRRHLAVNQKGSTKFQPGKVDEFTVEAVDLGDLEKVLVTKGPGDPWHLNKVVVKSGNFAASEAIFNYNSWLGDSNQKKEEVSTEIAVSGSESSAVAVPRDQAPHVPVSKGSWKVQTTTAKDHKKVPGLGVVVVLCGDQGETDPSPLSTDKKDAFNPGKVDEFLVKVSQDVGDLFKVRFGFSERTKDKMWKMQKVDFLDEDAGDHFSFDPNDRLIVDKTHDGWKELPIVWPAVPILPVVKYQVSVHIGDVHKIPPTMNMFIKMEGQRGTTGQRQLKKPVNRLQKDKVDVYEVEAVTLMDITKVTLAHDSKAAGSGFFLKKVVIKESAEAEKEFVFECEKWFDAGEDDKEIERVLLVGGGQAQVTRVNQPEQQEQVEEQQEAEPPAKSDDPPDCKVTVTTSSEDDSGTNAKVTLTVIGQSGDSGPLPLNKEAGKSPFVTGQTEQFDVKAKLADIGDIKKIRLEHDNCGNSPGWRVEKVVLENLKDSKKLEFGVNKHLSYEDEYGDVVVEVPVQGDQSAKKGPTAVKKYHVEVDTGESTGAGTDANVYITLYGEKGDSGKRNLKKSQEGGDMFEAGKIDTFIIEAVDLGKLSRVVIGHDSTGAGSSWKLDNVMVREGSDDDNKIIFHCGQWLDSEKGDGKTEREIFPQEDDDDDDDL